MKETKVYMELPENCFKCPFMTDNQEGYDGCFCKLLDERAETKNRLRDCPLIDIKTHDRELVKEVCEKIKKQLGFIVDGQERISCDGSATGDKTILAVLNQIQKEFEK